MRRLASVVLLFLAGSAACDGIDDNSHDSVLSLPLTFDSAEYVKERIALLHEYYADDTGATSAMMSQAVTRLFAYGCPQAFWQTLYHDMAVSEVYFALESASETTPRFTAHAVFRSQQSYYLATWSHDYYEGPADSFSYSCDSCLELKYMRLTRAEVGEFLQHINDRYNPLEMESFEVKRLCSHPVFAFVTVAYGGKRRIIYAYNVRELFFPSLYELGYFRDRLVMEPALESRVKRMSPELSRTFDSIAGIDSMRWVHLRDSLLKFWPDSTSDVEWLTRSQIRP